MADHTYPRLVPSSLATSPISPTTWTDHDAKPHQTSHELQEPEEVRIVGHAAHVDQNIQ
eukprot:COSAG01_NODE_45185_length_411_cov_6.483974_1_plen_58_part_01